MNTAVAEAAHHGMVMAKRAAFLDYYREKYGSAHDHPEWWAENGEQASKLWLPPTYDRGFSAERVAQVQNAAAGRELTSRELREVTNPRTREEVAVGGGGSEWSYFVINGAMPTAAAPVMVTTGTAIKTMLQLKPATGYRLRAIEWGASYDGSSAATPGKVEFLETDVTAAAITAYATADVMPWGDTGSVANTSGTSGVPLNLGTTHSGYTSSSTEGTITATRIFDTQLLPPTAPYVKQFPLNREPDMTVQKFIRIRNTFGTAINAYYYVIFVV